MARKVVHLVRPKRMLEYQVLFGSHALTFRHGTHHGGAVGVADLPDDHPGLEDIIQSVRALPRFYQVVEHGDEVDQVPEEQPQAPVKDPFADYPPPVAQAFRNGWTLGDITGSGDGEDWGPGGGRGAGNGLTMAESALSTPPEKWEERREAFWPWEIVGWRGPGLHWKPPRMPHKAGYQAATATTSEKAEQEQAAMAPVPETTPSPSERPSLAPEPDESAAVPVDLADYGDQDTVDRAVRVLQVLMADGGGKVPSRQKVNSFFRRKAEPPLPNVTDEQLEALARLVPTPPPSA